MKVTGDKMFKFKVGDMISYIYVTENKARNFIGATRGSGKISRMYMQEGKNVYIIDNEVLVFEDEAQLVKDDGLMIWQRK